MASQMPRLIPALEHIHAVGDDAGTPQRDVSRVHFASSSMERPHAAIAEARIDAGIGRRACVPAAQGDSLRFPVPFITVERSLVALRITASACDTCESGRDRWSRRIRRGAWLTSRITPSEHPHSARTTLAHPVSASCLFCLWCCTSPDGRDGRFPRTESGIAGAPIADALGGPANTFRLALLAPLLRRSSCRQNIVPACCRRPKFDTLRSRGYRCLSIGTHRISLHDAMSISCQVARVRHSRDSTERKASPASRGSDTRMSATSASSEWNGWRSPRCRGIAPATMDVGQCPGVCACCCDPSASSQRRTSSRSRTPTSRLLPPER